MSKKKTVTNVMRMLNAAKIDFETVEYHADTVGENFGMEIARLTGIPMNKSYKTLVASGDKTGIIVSCVAVDKEIDLKKLAKASGNKKVEMIHVKDLLKLTGYARGSVSPIGMKKQYPTFVDINAEGLDKLTVSAGMCGAAVILTPSDLQKATKCVFADISREEGI